MATRTPTTFTPFTSFALRIDSDANSTVVESYNGAITLREILVVNTSNSIPVYLKIYDSLSAGVVLGTTVPTMIFRAPARGRLHLVIPTGVALATGLSYAVVTTGGTAGTSSPPATVSLMLGYSS